LNARLLLVLSKMPVDLLASIHTPDAYFSSETEAMAEIFGEKSK
jgi:hypothetical protein